MSDKTKEAEKEAEAKATKPATKPRTRKYTATNRFGYSGGSAEIGDTVELTAEEAKYFAKHKAIGPYVEDDEEGDE